MTIPNKPTGDFALFSTWGGTTAKPSATQIGNGWGGSFVSGTNLGSNPASTTRNWEQKYNAEWIYRNALAIDYIGQNVEYYTDSGSANAFVLTIASGEAPTSYTELLRVRFFSNFTSTGACTINVESIGVKNIVSFDGDAIASGQIEVGNYVEAVYDATNDEFVVANIQYTQEYVKTDGARAFTAPQAGVTPTSSSHLTTKGYVDPLINAKWDNTNSPRSLVANGYQEFNNGLIVQWGSGTFSTSGTTVVLPKAFTVGLLQGFGSGVRPIVVASSSTTQIIVTSIYIRDDDTVSFPGGLINGSWLAIGY